VKGINMKSFARTLLVVLGLGVGVVGHSSSSAQAQAYAAATQLRVDVAGGFTVIHANEGPAVCGCFYMNGGSGELAVTNSHNISFVTNVGYTSQTNIGNINRNLALLTVLEGGRYTLDHGGRFAPFGQGMVGIAKTSTNYKIDQSAARLALAVGGGVDLRLTNHFSIRPAEVEYLFTTIPNGQNNFQNQLRMTAGIVWHVNGASRR
jgi:opacity protein-like surface antigen